MFHKWLNKGLKLVLGWICIFLFIWGIYLYQFPKKIFAAELMVDCGDKGRCTLTGLEPLFSTKIDGYWFPGKSLTKTVTFTNSSQEIKLIAIRPRRTSPPSPLEKVMHLRIWGEKGLLWSDFLINFYSQDKIDLENFKPATSRSYNFNLSLPINLGTEYQNLQTVFDLQMGFWEENVLGEKTGAQKGFSWWHWFLLPFPLLTLILFFSLLLGL